MTADDIIVANPGSTWTPRKIGHRAGLEGVGADGSIVWVIWKDEHHVSGPGPWSAEQTREAKRVLEGVQPGTEFRTVAADSFAAAVRRGGLTVMADANGLPRVLFGSEMP